MDFDLSLFVKNNLDKISLSFILMFFALITFFIVWINSTTDFLGKLYGDVYLYLIFALRLSGVNFAGYAYVNNLPPLVPFLTSVFFRLNYSSFTSIFVVSGIFYFVGVIFFYKLLRLRFNNLYSILGAVVYGLLTVNLTWAANGTIDIPSVSLSIICMYGLVKAFGDNQKYFYLVFPMFVLSFFGKYTAALILPIILVYYFLNSDSLGKLRAYIKNIVGAVLFSLLFTVPYFVYLRCFNLNLGFSSQVGEIASESASVNNLTYNLVNNIGFYLATLPKNLNSSDLLLGYLLIGFFILGFIVLIYRLRRMFHPFYNSETISLLNIDVSFDSVYKLLCIDIFLLFFVFVSAGSFSVVYSLLLMFSVFYLMGIKINKIFKKYGELYYESMYHGVYYAEDYNRAFENKISHLNFDLLMFFWFYTYFIFFTSHYTKTYRYFITMAPGFIALTVAALKNFLNLSFIRNINFRFGSSHINLSAAVILIMILCFIVSGLHFLSISKYDPLVSDEEDMAQYLKTTYPDYVNNTVCSDRGPVYVWYLHKEVKYMPYTTNESVIKHNLKKENVKYYISNNPNLKFNEYKRVISFNNTTLYCFS